MNHRGLAFGDFRLDGERGTLARGDEELTLRRKSFAVLQYLARNPGRLVSREELFREIWGPVVVTDGTLTQCLIDIRRALDDRSQSIVRTVRGRGVRFELPVREWIEPAGPPAAAAPPPQSLESRRPVASAGSPSAWSATRDGGPASLRQAVVACLGLLLLGAAAWMYAGREADGTLLAAQSTPASPAAAPGEDAANRVPAVVMSAAAGLRVGVRKSLAQALFLYNRRGPGDFDRAAQLYRQVLQLHPASAEAWAGLSALHFLHAVEADDPREHLAAAAQAAERAVSLDPASVEAHFRLARAVAEQGDAARAARLRARAAELAPEHPLVLAARAGDAATAGQLDVAIDLYRRATDADPISLVNHVNMAFLLLAAGRAAQAEAVAMHALVLHPPVDGAAHVAEQILADALILQRRLDEAAAVVERWPAGRLRDRAEALIHASRGDPRSASVVVARLRADGHWESALWLAEVHARMGAPEAARRWAATAKDRARARSPQAAHRVARDLALSPFFRELAAGPRARRLAAG